MAIFLDRVNSVPIINAGFSFELTQWFANTVDTINEIVGDTEDAFNLFSVPNYTTTQINDMHTAGDLINGILLYDSILNVYVGQISGNLVKFTTTAYP